MADQAEKAVGKGGNSCSLLTPKTLGFGENVEGNKGERGFFRQRLPTKKQVPRSHRDRGTPCNSSKKASLASSLALEREILRIGVV